MPETRWILQKIVAEDPGSMMVEWDTFNVGVVEEDLFRTIYSCWSQEEAEFLLAALRWYTSFKEGNVPGVEQGKAQPKPVRKKKITQE